jgi:hypothetical protein
MEPFRAEIVDARIESRQMSIGGRDAQFVCAAIGLDCDEAVRLRKDKLISFDPRRQTCLDDSQAAELTFLGSLVLAGCSRSLLRVLLRDLRRPYCYDIDRIFYDWHSEHWKLKTWDADPEGAFFELLERLLERNQHDALKNIQGWLDEALDVDHDRVALFHHAGEQQA